MTGEPKDNGQTRRANKARSGLAASAFAHADALRRKPRTRNPIATSKPLIKPEDEADTVIAKSKRPPAKRAMIRKRAERMRPVTRTRTEASPAEGSQTGNTGEAAITEPFRKVDAPVDDNAAAIAAYASTSNDRALRSVQWFQGGLVTAALIIGGVLFLLLPKQQISDDENRELAPPPVFSLAAFFEGEFSDDTEAYYNDNFLLRDVWLNIADQIKGLRGFRDDDAIEVVRKPPVAAPKINERADPELEADPEYQKVRALIITKGRAVQNFGGSPAMVSPFADLMNDYRAAIPKDVKVYSMVIPSGSDFFLPKEVHDGELRERDNIDAFNDMLDPSIITASAYDELAPHTRKYIWFNTDHHWTGLGAYYAYRAFVRTAGFKPLPLGKFTRKRLPGTFLGSLYRQTRSSSLQANPDFTEYWKIPNKAKAYLVDWRGNESEIPLYFEEARGGNSYGVFLGGDKPVIRIVSDRKNGRKLVMIKDSYGNALAPYLAANFEEVVVVDFRFFKGKITDLIEKYGATDFLYAHNSFAVNTPGTVKLGREMLGQGPE